MKKLIAAASAVGVLAFSTAALASVSPVLDTVTPEGSNYRFTYSGTLAGDQGLVNGSQLIIYDFAGYVPGSIDAAAYPILTSVELTSSLPLVPGFTDDPTLYNLVFTWNGGPTQASGGPFADTDFTGLSAASTYSAVTLEGYAALAVTNNGAATGQPTLNFGSVGVPTPVPEPMTWALMIVGFGGLGLSLRAQRRFGLA